MYNSGRVYGPRAGFTEAEVNVAYDEVLGRAEGHVIARAIDRHHTHYHAVVERNRQLENDRAQLIYLLHRQQEKNRGAARFAKECHAEMKAVQEMAEKASAKRIDERLKEWAAYDELMKMNRELRREKFDAQTRNIFTTIWAIAASCIAVMTLIVHFGH